jgi:hypothetical protein
LTSLWAKAGCTATLAAVSAKTEAKADLRAVRLSMKFSSRNGNKKVGRCGKYQLQPLILFAQLQAKVTIRRNNRKNHRLMYYACKPL